MNLSNHALNDLDQLVALVRMQQRLSSLAKSVDLTEVEKRLQTEDGKNLARILVHGPSDTDSLDFIAKAKSIHRLAIGVV